MSAQRIAARYAKSLVDLALDQDKLERVMEDVSHFQEATKVRDLQLMLKSPIIHGSTKGRIFKALFAEHYDPLTMAFLDIIVRKGRESFLEDIAGAFVDQYRDIKQISAVKVTTAVPLDAARLEQIKEKIISSGVTYPNIDLETAVDPSIMGGFVLEFEDKLYDASVMRQLDELRKEFSGKN